MKEIQIVFENEEIVVVNKPHGISVQGGKDVKNPLDKILPEILGYPIYLVHRLDKETSGLLIVAKSPFFAAKWTKMIEGKLVQKEYTALCIGNFQKSEGEIQESIIQHGNEKHALTKYKVASKKEFDFSEEGKFVVSKVHLVLKTGRMHQIRIHLSKLGFPILGDDKHGNFKINKIFRKKLGTKNLMLCADRLSLPIDGKKVVLKIETPEYFPF